VEPVSWTNSPRAANTSTADQARRLFQPGSASDAAFSARNHPDIVHLITTWTDPADTQRCTSWTNEAYETSRPHGPASAYLDFVGDEGLARIRASFGESPTGASSG
jgi:hypothetical protein